ncbi:TIR domain-containing protein [Qipengyuania aurantiaca]|uniref:TIR domain-containing protein n=1 Tax=Qipengyuania aurantiaca TaxID=2867233 RepID=A0ABX8ZJV6_9SPHN|nr:TIR domain-containing protein [Qipengyuania aurantiaca]QZD89303.1 TIR domain-containing protein [Qipengyuania aurantiaca]
MAEIFISYARSTAEQAQAAARGLREEGYEVWIDDALPAHREFSVVIEEKLREVDAVLVVWSDDARRSRWVLAEADLAHEQGKLVQFSLDGTIPPFPFNRVHCEQGIGWSGDITAAPWRKIVASVEDLAGTGADTLPGLGQEFARPTSRDPLLAVMPFDNFSADAELDFFCDGISEEIQRTVASGSSLKVVARASSFQFRGADKDTARVASALGATHLLDGSVRRAQNRVRISAELVECTTRSAIWADRFDGELDDVFDLQERIAEKVAEALKVALTPAHKEEALDPASYEAYMRARGIMAEGDPLFDDAYRESIPLLERVVEAAPNFAPAWESLAECRAWTLRSGRYDKAYHIGRDGVIEAAKTALRLDAKSGGAYVALAMLEPWGAYAEREALLLKALEVSPRDTAALTDMSTFCWSVGRFRDGLRYAERACELNPLMPSARLNVAQMRAYVGDIDICVAMHEQLHRQWPDNPGILISLVNTAGTLGYWDAFDRAVPDVGQLNEWQSRDMRAALAFAQAVRTKDPELIDRRMTRYREYLDKTGHLPLNLVVSIGEFGLPDEALDMAERASYDFVFNPDGARPSAYFPGTIMGPWSKVLQKPRFVHLCTRLGFSEYWKSTGKWPDCEDWVEYDFRAEVEASLEAAQGEKMPAP